MIKGRIGGDYFEMETLLLMLCGRFLVVCSTVRRMRGSQRLLCALLQPVSMCQCVYKCFRSQSMCICVRMCVGVFIIPFIMSSREMKDIAEHDGE